MLDRDPVFVTEMNGFRAASVIISISQVQKPVEITGFGWHQFCIIECVFSLAHAIHSGNSHEYHGSWN